MRQTGLWSRVAQIAAMCAGLLACLGIYDWFTGRFIHQGSQTQRAENYEQKLDEHLRWTDEHQQKEFEETRAEVLDERTDVADLKMKVANMEGVLYHIDGMLDALLKREGIPYQKYGAPPKGGGQP